MRSDAERNRERILAAARRLYAREGLDVSMARVAREAGVGVATLHRRFPCRDELINTVFAGRMNAYAEAVASAAAEDDPWSGFTGFLEEICTMQAADRGFADVMTMTFPTAKELESVRAEAYHGMVGLIERAKDAGQLRSDFVPEDVVVLLMANAGVIAATGEAAPGAWRRLVGYMCQAFATPVEAPLPEAPSPTSLYRAMLRFHKPSAD